MKDHFHLGEIQKCVDCEKNYKCSKCTYDTCERTSCSDGFYFLVDSNSTINPFKYDYSYSKCVLQCPEGYYAN